MEEYIKDPANHAPDWLEEIQAQVSLRLSDLENANFEPIDLLMQNGFMPLDSLILKVSKPLEELSAEQALEFEILDEYDMLGNNLVAKQMQAQAQKGVYYGVAFSQEALTYSPYFVAMAFAASLNPDNPIFMEDPDFLLQMYANIYKLHREIVEGNVSIDLARGSPITSLVHMLKNNELPLRPRDNAENEKLLMELKRKAQKEFCRACTSNASQAIDTFLIDCRAGNQIYPNFVKTPKI